MKNVFLCVALLGIGGCSGTREQHSDTSFMIEPVNTPVGMIGPLKGKVSHVEHEQTTGGPDWNRIGDGAGVVGGFVGGLPGPIGMVGGLVLSAASGLIALRNQALKRGLRQTVEGIQAAKEHLEEASITVLHTELNTAQDESTRKLVKEIKS